MTLDARHGQVALVPLGSALSERWSLGRWDHGAWPEQSREPSRSLTLYVRPSLDPAFAAHWQRSEEPDSPLEVVLEHGSSPHALEQIIPLPAHGLVVHVVAPYVLATVRRRRETFGPLEVRSSLVPGRPLCFARSVIVGRDRDEPIPAYATHLLESSAALSYVTPSGRLLRAGMDRAIPSAAVAVRSSVGARAIFEVLS